MSRTGTSTRAFLQPRSAAFHVRVSTHAVLPWVAPAMRTLRMSSREVVSASIPPVWLPKWRCR